MATSRDSSTPGQPRGLLAMEADVARRAADGDREAFDRLYDAVFPLVWGLSLRLRGQARDAERLTERILERVVLELGGCAEHGSFAEWVYRIVTRAVEDETRVAPEPIATTPTGRPIRTTEPR